MKAHGAVSKWLMQDEQKELFEILVALVLNVVFLTVLTLLLWPLGRSLLALRLAMGYGVLWVLTWAFAMLGNRIQDYFRVNIYDRANAFVFSNLAVSCLLQVGWAIFAAHLVRRFIPGAETVIALMLGIVGLVSCFVAFFAVTSFYHGHIYKLISLPLGLLSFIVFAFGGFL